MPFIFFTLPIITLAIVKIRAKVHNSFENKLELNVRHEGCTFSADKQHRQIVTLHQPFHWGITRLLFIQLTGLEPSIHTYIHTYISFIARMHFLYSF